ncbi:hypothetical protein ECDEC11C_5830 [Escherichia coli DEC11C]|nr:hypothetical protein ECDEC11C_5830 [Escherichia coli DEC11C]
MPTISFFYILLMAFSRKVFNIEQNSLSAILFTNNLLSLSIE